MNSKKLWEGILVNRNYNTEEIDDEELEMELELLGDELLVEDDSYLNVPEVPMSAPEGEKALKGERPMGA